MGLDNEWVVRCVESTEGPQWEHILRTGLWVEDVVGTLISLTDEWLSLGLIMFLVRAGRQCGLS